MSNINTGSQSEFLDYYEILQCHRTATNDELKKSYQNLILTTHPDKVSSHQDRFLLIQKAWNVLRDPESRKVYDAELSSSEHNNSDVLLFDVISFIDMDFDGDIYTYLCRCGSNYVLEEKDKNTNRQSVIIDCEECSFSLKVNL